jgi:hypothetical protein
MMIGGGTAKNKHKHSLEKPILQIWGRFGNFAPI